MHYFGFYGFLKYVVSTFCFQAEKFLIFTSFYETDSLAQKTLHPSGSIIYFSNFASDGNFCLQIKKIPDQIRTSNAGK